MQQCMVVDMPLTDEEALPRPVSVMAASSVAVPGPYLLDTSFPPRLEITT